MKRDSCVRTLCVLLVAACVAWGDAGPQPPPSGQARDLGAQARELAQRLLILDGHIDVPYRLQDKMEDISVRTEEGDFDYPRARAGGLDAPFMSIYTPASLQEKGGSKKLADELIDLVERIAADHPDKFALARSVADVRKHFGSGRISLPLGMENGAPLEGEIENLEHFYDRGIRYITLVHGTNNRICDSSYDDQRRWHGLSPFGKRVVAEMNRLGILIDVSHVSDEAFYQVMEVSRTPVVASHSSCRHFTPGWERNMDDAMIRLLAQKGGVIQINFGSSFLSDRYRRAAETRRAAIAAYWEQHGLSRGDEAAREYEREYERGHPIEVAELGDVVAHIDHVVEIAGIDHVGLGSDFDGVGDSLPRGLEDVSKYPNLIEALLEAGYTEDQIEKICSGNVLRVWSEVERTAAVHMGDDTAQS